MALAPIALGSLSADAQSSAEVRSRTLFDQARQLADAKRWKEACPLFQAAHDLNSTGGTALQAANCYEKIDKPERAIELYQFILTRPDAQKNPDRVAIAEERVRVLREQLPKPEPAPTATPAAPPTATPEAPATATPAVPPTTTPSAAPTAPSPPVAPPNRTPAFISFGVAGAGFAVGAIFGALALSQANAVNSRCEGTRCLPSDAPNKDAALAKGWVSNAGFGVGIVGAVVGVVLVATAGAKPRNVTASGQGLTIRF